MEVSPVRLKEKSVIIHRDENGFGLRVGGQNPVFVDCVHENGAAWKAGVRKDDRIIKVNGTLVRSYDHHCVVQMIQNCSPFVNLTLHSPEPISRADCSGNGHPYTLGVDQNNGNIISVGNSGSCGSSGANVGSPVGQSNSMNIHSHNHHSFNHPHPSSSLHLNQWRHPHQHSLHGNLNWLLDIGDDLFQDNQQKQSLQQQHQPQEQLIPLSQQSMGTVGVSKLIVSGPNLLNHSNSNVSSLSSSSKHTRSQSNNNTRDNPYYYYKTANQKHQTYDSDLTSSTCNTNNTSNIITTSSSTASLLGATSNHDGQTMTAPNATITTTSKASSSMTRSKSSSKMSTRSTTSKYAKARKRLVEDLKSLAIANSQATPSSLSTSPSSSDLSDCDDLDQPGISCLTGARLDCGLVLNSSNLSHSPNSMNTIMIDSMTSSAATLDPNLNSSTKQSAVQQGQQQQNYNHQHQMPITFNINGNNSNKPVRLTTRRLEIIRELVDTEKTHNEKLKQLNDLLYKPIKAENLISADQLKMVFSCHKTLFKIHRQIYKKLLAAQVNYSEQPQHQQHPLQEPLVGKALVEIFEGELGKRLERAASLFCACQSTNTELLNRITRKDTKSGEFLAQVANQQMLGRLGIKDLLASCFQRLTKYPLLLDNLLKATPNLAATSGQQNLGMMHSKSLSESSILVQKSATAVAPTNSVAINNDSNNSNLSNTFDEANKDSSQSGNESIPSEKSAQASNSLTKTVHYESIDELDLSDSSSLGNTTLSSTTSSSTTNATTTAPVKTGPVPPGTQSTALSALSDEYAYERFCIERALQSSRQILIHVNEAVNRAIAQNKLKEVWKKTDKNPSLPVIDIENQQLLHEGPLTLRLNRRQIEVYVLLLTQYLIILTRESQDKYKLKHFISDVKTPEGNTLLSPIFDIDEDLATRDLATDDSGFYLLCKRKGDLRIFEFASQSPSERAKWKEKIHTAQMCNFATVPDDDNTLTRYTELISLTNSANTPNNIENNPTSSIPNSDAATVTSSTSGRTQAVEDDREGGIE